MADVFISYAREDRPRAEQIARALSAAGIESFWDTEIPPGKTWADYIEAKLSQCKALIVLWSANSAKSQWVREEARMGRDSGKLIPAMLDATPAPFGFGEVQAANLSQWRGEPDHPEWRRVRGAVEAALGGARQPQPAPRQQQQSFAGADAAEASSPVGYVRRSLKLYIDGAGRARRAEFGWFFLFCVLASAAGWMLDAGLFGTNYFGQPNATVFWALAGLGLICPLVSVASRRFHDIGVTGWAGAVMVIPYLNVLAAIAISLIPGQPRENKYGPSPKPA